ncbi:transposase [Myxococcota bacterium]|nr:transposase [Myxococcota bacterium]
MIPSMAWHFKPYNIDQLLLLPLNLREWLPNDHLALYLAELLNAMDLSAIWESYERKDSRGRDGYHPMMMVRLIVHGYSIGVTSSRKIEKATYEDVAFRVLSADLHPDHDTIANMGLLVRRCTTDARLAKRGSQCPLLTGDASRRLPHYTRWCARGETEHGQMPYGSAC